MITTLRTIATHPPVQNTSHRSYSTKSSTGKNSLHLYRELIRIGASWPSDLDRPGRNLREKIVQKVRHEFQKNKNVKDQQVISQLQNEGWKEYTALDDIFNNKSAYEVL